MNPDILNNNLIAIIYRHTPMTVGRMFKEGLNQLGANVVSIGDFGGTRVWWEIERTHEDYLDVPDIIVKPDHTYKASYIIGKIEEKYKTKPALILQIDGDTHVCNDLGATDTVFVTIATDPHLPSKTNLHASGCSTYFYCMQTNYMHPFGERARYLPYGYDPKVHFSQPAEKIYDVVCIGFQFVQRKEFGERLAKLGLNVRFENGPVFDEYRTIMNQSWICFNLSAIDDLNMRVFESLACGTFLLSNITPDMGRFFADGIDYVGYTDLDDAQNKILYYLENKELLTKIAAKGHETVKPYTYANRLRQLFSEIGFDYISRNVSEAPCIPDPDVEQRRIDRLFDSAQQLVDQFRYEDAMHVLRYLLGKDQKHGPAHNKLGLLFFEAGANEDAMRHFELSDLYAPDDPGTMSNLANLYYMQGQTEKALEVFTRLAAIQADDPEVQVAAAKLNIVLGRKEEAAFYFHKALAIDPENEEARSILSNLVGAPCHETPRAQNTLRIATIINFCTLDSRFLPACIANVRGFSEQIVVSSATHFFDGTPENRDELEKLAGTVRDEKTEFLILEYDHSKTIQHGSRYWHNLARWSAMQRLNDSIDYVLFLDADEIIEGERFAEWLDAGQFKDYDAVAMAANWYFREPSFRATSIEEAGLLVKRSLISKDLIFDNMERWAFLRLPSCSRFQTGLDGQPLLHHYSWVRTKDEMLRKVSAWGHNRDKDWAALVHAEFEHEFNGRDFVHGYSYSCVEPYIAEGLISGEYRLAVDMIRTGDVAAAICQLENVLRMDSNHVPSMNQLALLYYQSGELQRALKTFETAASRAPWESDTLKNLANLYFELNDSGSALKIYQAIEALSPDDIEVLLSAGNLNYILGQKEQAAAYFSRILKLDPNHQIARQNITLMAQKYAAAC